MTRPTPMSDAISSAEVRVSLFMRRPSSQRARGHKMISRSSRLWTVLVSTPPIRSATNPRPGSRPRDRSPATARARSRARGRGGAAGSAARRWRCGPDDDQVDVEGARRAGLGAFAAEGVLDGQCAIEQRVHGQRGVDQHDGVEELAGVGGSADGLGLIDRGDRDDGDLGGVLEGRRRRPAALP